MCLIIEASGLMSIQLEPIGFYIDGVLDEVPFADTGDGFGTPMEPTELGPEPQRRPAVFSGDNKTLERVISSLEPVVLVAPVTKLVPKRRLPFTSPRSEGKTGRTPQDMRVIQVEWYGGWQNQRTFKKRNVQQILSSSSGSGSCSDGSGSYSGESDR